jgi:hypothetical protein
VYLVSGHDEQELTCTQAPFDFIAVLFDPILMFIVEFLQELLRISAVGPVRVLHDLRQDFTPSAGIAKQLVLHENQPSKSLCR